MEGLVTLLIFAGLFFIMMRYGCGAHITHGHGGHKHSDNEKDTKHKHYPNQDKGEHHVK